MGVIRDNVRRNLGYYLSLSGISQKELARRIGVSQSAVTNWIKGKNSPDIETVALICDIFEISVTELFGTNGRDRFTDTEKRIIKNYREKWDMQKAVNILLGIESGNQ